MTVQAEQRLAILRSAPLNSWVALSRDESRIVAVAESFSEVSRKSEAAGEPDPVILKTPAQWAPLSV